MSDLEVMEKICGFISCTARDRLGENRELDQNDRCAENFFYPLEGSFGVRPICITSLGRKSISVKLMSSNRLVD